MIYAVVAGTVLRGCSRQAAYSEIAPGECKEVEPDRRQMCVCNTPLCNE